MDDQNKIGGPVVVTTEFRGVFFGTLKAMETIDGNLSVKLANAQNCVYWNEATRGFLGLASKGPQDGCKIGPKVPELLLGKVTSIAVCTEEAVVEWEKEKWS
jgi:hypothetical protein